MLTIRVKVDVVWRLFPILFLSLVACGGPSLHFAGAVPTRVSVEGSVFDVRIRGNLAEAVRRNPQYAPRLGRIGGRAARAMVRVSGCRVDGVLGDQAVVVGLLDCGASGRRIRYMPLAHD